MGTVPALFLQGFSSWFIDTLLSSEMDHNKHLIDQPVLYEDVFILLWTPETDTASEKLAMEQTLRTM